MILAIFDLQVTLMLPTKFQVNWPFGLGKEAKNRFSKWSPWRPSWISIWTILLFLYLQVILMILTKFQVTWPFGSEEEAKSRFSKWPPWRLSWISDRNDDSYFWSTIKSPRCFLSSVKSNDRLVQEEKWKIDFQDGRNGGHLGFPIETILAVFDLQVTPMLPSFQGSR